MINNILSNKGKHEKFLNFLLSGGVDVIRGGKSIAQLHRVSDMSGVMDVLDNKPRSVSVIAFQQTSCLLVDVLSLKKIEEKGRDLFHALVFRMFAEMFAQRLRETTEELMNVRDELAQLKST